MIQVPFVDLKTQYLSIKDKIDKAIEDVLMNSSFIGGEVVSEFENQFASLYGAKHCISVGNGTDSLYIIMKMYGIGPGDEVITVANSWISSSETISQTGATPVFVDIDPVYYTIDHNLIESRINANTKAIMPVHLQGQMCEMNVIMDIAKRHNLIVIEDCAQSHFSSINGKYAGLLGNASSFSFYPGKNLGAYGDAGCILTNDSEMADRFRMYARHGALKKHEHQIEGINSRLDGLQAAILSVKLPHILKWTQQRIKIAEQYRQQLATVKQVITPTVRPDSTHTFHLYVIQVEDRKSLIEHLKSKGIETAIHYPKILPNLDAYKYLNYTSDDFPVANSMEGKILSLPIFPEMSSDQVLHVCNSIKNFYN
jgi:dTDP-4-amino-4,6-dideoxygalactose transaminase